MVEQLFQIEDPPGSRGPEPQAVFAPVRVKCMGRTYRAVEADGALCISDITDITRPVLLGRASADGAGGWEVCSTRGRCFSCPPDLLHAVAALRRDLWPPRDPH
ncbi:hypothetical protein GXW83_21700 [Streptacidiphilus sp. PB12-B1b]|uniref:hypothetical protein n=1 Tax=Streptacidiphilus sp. PB12-B1b TaxID=2705012 RepID=UPI0015F7CC3B|nr:hypothetical protein [Streptacidiphilus sp. PB12-B1b]QMU77919.1 hypothetical protein GXW83_21700 [Streptacidiphilus sp. PB12-B1b]